MRVARPGRRAMRRTLPGLFASVAAVAFLSGTAPAQPIQMAKLITFTNPIDGTPLQDVLDYLKDRHDIGVRVDEEAFAKIGNKAVMDSSVSLPSMTKMPAGFVLEVIGLQIGGIVKEE